MNKRRVYILTIIILFSIGMMLMLNSVRKEQWTIYRMVSPFVEKVIKNRNDYNKLENIIKGINIEIERESDLTLYGGVYLIRLESENNTKEYIFFSKLIYYVELKDGEVIDNKWYKSDEGTISQLDNLFLGTQ